MGVKEGTGRITVWGEGKTGKGAEKATGSQLVMKTEHGEVGSMTSGALKSKSVSRV